MDSTNDNLWAIGEKLVTGEMSLVLPLSTLSQLNEKLQSSSSETIRNSSPSELNTIEGLSDIAESLKCIKLCPGENTACETGAVNLCFFPNIKALQIKRINVEEITFNPSTLTNLDELKCMFAQESVNIILKKISSRENIYHHLTKLELQYNKLTSLDSELLRSLPLLSSLDLSNNRLTGLDISENPCLISLNVSFNMLQTIPYYGEVQSPILRILLLHNNLICDDGLAYLKDLENLKELSLANNMLSEDDCLSELSDLPILTSLSLMGNPLSMSKSYRLSSVKYLHENACVNHFILDGKKLSREEKLVVGTFVSPTYVPSYPYRPMDQSFEILVPSVSSTSTLKPKKSVKTRDALISENVIEKAPRKIINKPESPKKHLETKVQIESLRDHFGEENWLHKKAGFVIQNLMGLQGPAMANAGTNTETMSNSSVSIFATSPNNAAGAISDEFEAEPSLLDHDESFEQDEEGGEYILPDDGVVNNNDSGNYDSDNADWDSSESTIYNATREPDNKHVFLFYNSECLKEKDSLNPDKVTVWPSKNITSCSQVNSDGAFTRVIVTFHSIKPSLRERVYSMESPVASLFCSNLREELESRPLSAMNQTAYRCIKCASLFSVEKTNNNRYQRVRCQACGSNAVVEMEEPPLPSVQNGSLNKTPEVRGNTESNEFLKSPSQSSIGSANSLKTIQDVPIPRRNDSDIEVISNPSQSSVEILEIVTRKKSSEERQLVPVPEVVISPEQNVSGQGLTESSSSGSLTDSICTAYDGSRRRTVVHDDCTVLVEEDENKPDRNEAKNMKNKIISHDNDQKSDFINEDSIQLSHTDFSEIDHRVKLHLLTAHFKINEDFVCSLKCRTMVSGQTENCLAKLVAFSTSFIYVFRIVGNTVSDDIESWLKLELSYNISQVESITLLPFQMGFHVSIKSNQYIKDNLTLLLDPRQTVNFNKFVNECSHFKAWDLRVKVSGLEKLLSQVIVESLEEHCDTCSVFLSPVVHSFQIVQNVPLMTSSKQMVAVILTESFISLKYKFCESLLQYENNLNVSPFPMDCSVSIKGLLNMDIQRNISQDIGCYFTTLMFEVEEDNSKKDIWKLGFVTKDELTDFTDLVQQGWEKMFALEFPYVSYSDDQ
uniref:Serine/threonine-protein kinase 11-interacting protein n=1 Tax=Cacopsylla melanoneura TaxID=428564 RepID=A0A8D9DYS3_9HEMI